MKKRLLLTRLYLNMIEAIGLLEYVEHEELLLKEHISLGKIIRTKCLGKISLEQLPTYVLKSKVYFWIIIEKIKVHINV